MQKPIQRQEEIMADGTSPSIKSRVSEAEWQVRVELAALYRLVALHCWDDICLLYTSPSPRDS